MIFKFDEISKVFKGDFWSKPFVGLDRASFIVNEGNVVGFLGANGAGKTTAIKILLGFIKETSGGVSFGPSLGKKKKDIFRNIGYLPERPYFYPDLTAREFLRYIGHLNELKRSEVLYEIDKWTKLLRIDFALDRKLRLFSKGMLQRLGFSAALINNPTLLILDEPLAGLDPIGRKEFKQVMSTLASEGKTIFFSSHIIHDVEEVSSEVVILENGKMVYSGNVQKLIQENSEEDYELSVVGENPIEHKLFESRFSSKGRKTYFIKNSNLHEALEFLSKNKLEIHNLTKLTPTLEEIVYKVER